MVFNFLLMVFHSGLPGEHLVSVWFHGYIARCAQEFLVFWSINNLYKPECHCKFRYLLIIHIVYVLLCGLPVLHYSRCDLAG